MHENHETNEQSWRQLRQEAQQRLAELLNQIPWVDAQTGSINQPSHHPHDFEVSLKTQTGEELTLYVELKSDAKPSTVLPVLAQLHVDNYKPDTVHILISQRISPRVADLCEKNNVSWMDLAGNCKITGPRFYIHRSGIPQITKPRPGVDLGSWAVGRVLRVLLAPENAGRRWTQREIEVESSNPRQPMWPTTPASLGLINKVIRHLKDEAYLEEPAQRGFILRQPVELLMAWKASYRHKDHARSAYFTLLQESKLSQAFKHVQMPELAVVYASFSAASIQAPAVRHLRNWLFVHPIQVGMVVEAAQAKSVDSGENLVLITPADDGVFYLQDWKDDRLPCTNPVQTYLDLRHGGGRGEEAAEAILEQRLKPAWKKAGLL